MKIGDLLVVVVVVVVVLALSIDWLKGVDHCEDCPSVTCLCIQNVDGSWVLSPEVGDAEEDEGR